MKSARFAAVAAVLGLSILAAPRPVDAWGAGGHRLVGVAAMRGLPDSMPAFLRSQSAIADVGEYSREPDRWRGAGQPHARERETAHFIDMYDAGHVLTSAGPTLAELPRLKSEYDAMLTRAGLVIDDAGYLPYAIMDAWLQVKQDLAYWRVLVAAEARETDIAKKAWYRTDRERREALTLRDIGILSHYVADGSQPQHTSIHYNGWGDYPNPEGFTNSRQAHGQFEGVSVVRDGRLDAIEAAMPAPALDGFDLRPHVAAYLTESLGQITPLYRLEKTGAFRETTPEGSAFINGRLARGAAELRDLILLAWDAADDGAVGWPAVKVAEVEAGTADPWVSLLGND